MLYVYYHKSLISQKDFSSIDAQSIRMQSYETVVVKEGEYGSTYSIVDLKEFNEANCIFFSNVFDEFPETEVSKGSKRTLFNISTNYLVARDKEFWTNNKELTNNQVELHRASNILRQIQFIISNKDFKFDFELPESLSIGFVGGATKESNKVEQGFSEIYRNYINGILQQSKFIQNTLDRKIRDFIFYMINNYFDEFDKNPIDIKGKLPTIHNNGKLLDWITAILLYWKNLLYECKIEINGKIVALSESFINKVDSMIKLCQIIASEEFVFEDGSLRMVIRGEINKTFVSFMENYFKSYDIQPYLSFNWRHLSSGQKALLNMYSRFYSVKNDILENPSENMLILIDEGELYFHPQWQKSFLYNFIKFIVTIYTNMKIQIILTSNSPFVASDLPNTNIIFLNRDSTIVEALEDKKQTFAANIHTLLADSFFMQGVLIGDFAKAKINEVIELLEKDPKSIRENKDYIERLIFLIGEPLIRNKLISMLRCFCSG